MIDAQQARRALDYLVGFNLSPLLWKKIRRGLSAGRVQSPALRMIVEREQEIEAFVAREYWTIEADLTQRTSLLPPRLTHYRATSSTNSISPMTSRPMPSKRWCWTMPRASSWSSRSRRNSASAIRRRRSRPQRCNRRHRANSALAPSAP